ncbi:MAG: hypothetical protein IPK60_22985 [Sandaracinaceae bacterium]|nr:hypothetical protein [Sandaracinaceae bacterium]
MTQRLSLLGESRLTSRTMDRINGPAAAIAVLAFFGPNQATLSKTLAPLTSSSTAAVQVSGSLSTSLASAALSSAGAVAIQGAFSASLDDATTVATAGSTTNAAASLVLSDCSATSATVVLVAASTAVTLDSASLDAAFAISQVYILELSAVLAPLSTALTFTALPEISEHIDLEDVPVNARPRVVML